MLKDRLRLDESALKQFFINSLWWRKLKNRKIKKVFGKTLTMISNNLYHDKEKNWSIIVFYSLDLLVKIPGTFKNTCFVFLKTTILWMFCAYTGFSWQILPLWHDFKEANETDFRFFPIKWITLYHMFISVVWVWKIQTLYFIHFLFKGKFMKIFSLQIPL